MAPRPGGEADKVGNRYELAWATRHALYCIVDPSRSLTIEDPDADLSRGSEFTYVNGGEVEVHQVKRQHGSSNYWSVSALAALRVFAAAEFHVGAGRRYRFVSQLPASRLAELAERARKSRDVESFTEAWLNADLRPTFDELTAEGVLGSAHRAWQVLRGMSFEVQDEAELVRMNAMFAVLHLEGSAGNAAALILGDVLLQNLGRRLTRAELLSALSAHGVSGRGAHAKATARESVNDLTDSWRRTVSRDELSPRIEREEASQATVREDSKRTTLVVGKAGGGKSCVLGQAVDQLRADEVPVLAMRLDRIEPVASTAELGQRFGLDSSPAAVLALAADGAEGYLVVDQLDAVSLASGRIPESFDTIVDLVREALSIPGLRVVLACREFDVQNDHRIRTLASQEGVRRVSVGALDKPAVDDAVCAMGLDASLLSPVQSQLLQSPLHLSLLSSISREPGALGFDSVGALFDAFWDRKRRSARLRRPALRFNETLAAIANAASERQTLSVPVHVLDDDDLIEDADVLVSEHVLSRDGDRIAFFHEAFFDYTFARQWVHRSESMVHFLLRDEQELFRRAQVRQILQSLHELEFGRFGVELEALLADERIRFHIKEAALAVFVSLQAPSREDVDLATRLSTVIPALASRMWSQLARGNWFLAFRAAGLVDDWLDSSRAELVDRALTMMRGASSTSGDAVASLLEQRSADPRQPAWVRAVTWRGDLQGNRRLFDLFLEAVRRGAYSDAESELWFTTHDLATHQPEWAVELLQVRLRERPDGLETAPDGKVALLSTNDYGVSQLVSDAAAGAPLAFIGVVLPYLMDVMDKTAMDVRGDYPTPDRHFFFRQPEEREHERDLDDALLASATRALASLASTDPATVQPMLVELAADPHDAAQYLLYKALAAAPEHFADWSAELLSENRRRLDCGYVSDSHWVARELVASASPFISDEAFARLEAALRDARREREWGRSYGWTAFTFLSALPNDRLSALGARRLRELRRKFGVDAPAPPQGVRGGSVNSPVATANAAKMSDRHWLRAMVKHSSDQHDWETMTGGAHELSQELRANTAQDPIRFARLALQMDESFHHAYGDAILFGLGDAEPTGDPSDVFAAVRHIADWRNARHDRWLGFALRKHLSETPLDLVALLLDRALQSKDPAEDLTVAGGEKDERAQNLFASGINTARGGLAESLGDLLVMDPTGNRTALVSPHLNQLAEDPVLSVRTCVAHTIAASLRHNRPAAYSAFEVLIDAPDILLATTHVSRLVRYIGNADSEVVLPLMPRMLDSVEAEVRTEGGRLAAFAALEWGATELVEKISHGGADVRSGAAHVASVRLSNTSNSALSTQLLLQSFSDADPTVRKAAAEVVLHLRDEPLRPFANLLHALIASAAFPYAAPQLWYLLENASDRLDDLTLAASMRFIEHFNNSEDEGSGALGGDAHQVAQLVVRGLAQANGPQPRKALLDVLDRLLETGAYGVEDAISTAARPS